MIAQPLPFSAGRQRSGRDGASPDSALCASVDGSHVTRLEHELLQPRRPAQQEPPPAARAGPLVGIRLYPAAKHHLVRLGRRVHLSSFRRSGGRGQFPWSGWGAKSRAAALARLQPQPGGPPLLVVATGPYAGEGFDCPALDTFFLAAPVANKGSLIQYVGRILRSHENKTTAEVHDYLDERTGVLAAMLAKRAPGYAGLGFSDPRKLAFTPSASTDSSPALRTA
jgi:hypothetical protein